jgi:hypothetical protein
VVYVEHTSTFRCIAAGLLKSIKTIGAADVFLFIKQNPNNADMNV